MIGVLLLHRTMPAEAVIAGMNAALSLDSCDPDLVAVEARRASHRAAAASDRAAGEAVGDRPAPSLTGYDQLLAGVVA